jgi:NADH-quinone oxidoreductase subunit F
MKKITRRLADGKARPEDVGLLKNVADNIAGRTICAFGEACSWPVQSFIAKFKDEFEKKAAGEVPGPAAEAVLAK